MLPRIAIVLTILTALAFVPVGSAGGESCANKIPKADAISVGSEVYLYLGSGLSDKDAGFWQETNQKDGLQLKDCGNAPVLYKADTRLAGLL